jgi:tetratricopeptide (TPR) repeat protein
MKKSRRLIIFVIIIVIVIGLAAATAILLSQHNMNVSTNPTSSKQSSTAPQELPAEKTADAADKLASSGNVAAGTQALDTAIKNTTNIQDQYVYYSRKATLLLNNNDLNGALAAAISAYNLRQSSDSAALVGQIARKKGDNQQAISYYTLALNHIDKTDPFSNEDTAYYKTVISDIQQGKTSE